MNKIAIVSVVLLAGCGSVEDDALHSADSVVSDRLELSGRAPALTSISPAVGPDTGGFALTLQGKNFRAGATVTVSGVSAPYVMISTTSVLYFSLPANPGAFGPVAVRVTNPDGVFAERSDLFSYYSDKIAWQPPGQQSVANAADVALGDFNKDGKLDAAVIDWSGSINILLGNGTGELTKGASYSVPGATNTLVRDTDGDGNADLVVNYGPFSGRVDVLRGKGDGTFEAAVPAYFGMGQSTFDIGELTPIAPGMEMVAGNESPYVYIVTAGGGFPFPSSMNTGLSQVKVIRIADIDKNGQNDIVALSPSQVSVMLNAGTLPTGGPMLTNTATSAVDFWLADLNGDSKLDVVVGTADGKVAVHLGNGDGTFGAATTYAANDPVVHVEVADLNGDGKLDVFAHTSNSTLGRASLCSLFGKGDGTLGSMVVSPNGISLQQAKLGDLTGDGKPDAAAIGWFPAPALYVLPNPGNGTFQDRQALPAGAAPGAVLAGDWNGDGKMDVATASFSGNSVTVLLGGPSLVFSSNSFTVGNGPAGLARGDFNGDGKLDLVSANYNSGDVSVLLGKGDGSFQPQTTFSVGKGAMGIIAADLNNDSKTDLAVAISDGNSVSVLISTGGGNFAAAASYAVGKAPTGIAVGDLSGDGRLDLVTANSEGASLSYLQQSAVSAGKFNVAKAIASSGSPNQVAVADLNSDGKLDLVTNDPDSSVLKVLLNAGAASFPTTTTAMNTCGLVAEFGAADLNGDGKLDLAASCGSDSSVRIAVGFGTGQFFPAQQSPTRRGPGALTLADMNADSKPDLVFLNEVGGTLGLLLNRTP